MSKKLSVFFATEHPDDVEEFCAGTLIWSVSGFRSQRLQAKKDFTDTRKLIFNLEFTNFKKNGFRLKNECREPLYWRTD